MNRSYRLDYLVGFLVAELDLSHLKGKNNEYNMSIAFHTHTHAQINDIFPLFNLILLLLLLLCFLNRFESLLHLIVKGKLKV